MRHTPKSHIEKISKHQEPRKWGKIACAGHVLQEPSKIERARGICSGGSGARAFTRLYSSRQSLKSRMVSGFRVIQNCFSMPLNALSESFV